MEHCLATDFVEMHPSLLAQMWLKRTGSQHDSSRFPLRTHGTESNKLSTSSTHEAIDGLRKSTMFKYASEENLVRIASKMRRVDLNKGEVIYYQGDPTLEMFIITRGAVTRTRLEEREHEHENLGSKGSEATIGALHLLRNEPFLQQHLLRAGQTRR